MNTPATWFATEAPHGRVPSNTCCARATTPCLPRTLLQGAYQRATHQLGPLRQQIEAWQQFVQSTGFEA